MVAETRKQAFTDLARENYIDLRTFKRSGDVVATPVWFVLLDDGSLYLYTGANAGKVKRIRHTARVTVTPCSQRGVDTGPTYEGHATLVTDPALIARVQQALATKYGFAYRLIQGISGLIAMFQRRSAERAYVAIAPVTAS